MICGSTSMTTGMCSIIVHIQPVLIGILPSKECESSAGSITIFGQDLRRNLSSCRSSMGFCPQFNCIFEHLTVNDHFWFFSKLKGAGGDWEADADVLCSSVGMQHLRRKASETSQN
ncbi:hypothetical protein COOONC_23921 [Cooperia oncophora]